jgi:5-hydroxyisourate hydrolase-like protein (transthyretin family)
MSSAKYGLLRLLIPLIIFLLGCPPPAPVPPPDVFVEEMPPDYATGIAILGATNYLAPESKGSLLVQVHAPYSNERLPDTRVRVTLNMPTGEAQQLFTGQTDENGLVQVNFDVPATISDPNQVLTVVADSTTYGQLQASQEVYVGRVYNVMLSTDKPVYQPGQIIHLRSLALDTTALKAAQEQPLVLTVADPAGNKLMRKTLTTSVFGIASTAFQLDSQAASGDYVLTAEMGPVTSSRTVEVKPYTLPRFAINFQSAKAFYLPGEIITGTVDAQYFFGKPVAGGQVSIKGFVTDVERVQLFELTGTTDATGFYAYEFQTPDTFVGQLENNTAEVDLEITVIDTANHSEQVDESVTIAEKTILIEAVPESGFLRPGLENIVYVQSSYPDGRAAVTTISVVGLPTATVTNAATSGVTNTVTVTTDEFGLATIRLTPPTNSDLPLVFTAIDKTGQVAEQTITLGNSGDAQALL